MKKKTHGATHAALRHESCNFRYARSFADHDVERTASQPLACYSPMGFT